MGLMTLEDFQEELQSSLGDRDFSLPRLNRWINFAYLDLAGALDMHEFDEPFSISVAPGTPGYPVASETRQVLFVVNEDDQNFLMYMDATEYFRLDRAATGEPTRWTRFGEEIFLHPTPIGSFTATAGLKITPDPLLSPAQTTVIPAPWDAAIVLLSVYYGLMFLGEEQRAQQWYARGVNYIQSRTTQEEMFVKTPGLGLAYHVPVQREASAFADAQQASGAR